MPHAGYRGHGIGPGYGSNFNGRRKLDESPRRDRSFQQTPLRYSESWRRKPELTLRLTGLPGHIGTYDLYNLLQHHGNVQNIRIFEDNRGLKDGGASVTFSPPPAKPFWELDKLAFRSEDGKQVWNLIVHIQNSYRTFDHPSPVRPGIVYPQRMTLRSNSIDFGFMHDNDKMMVMRTVKSCSDHDITFLLNLHHGEMVIFFSMAFRVQNPKYATIDGKDQFKFQIPLRELGEVWSIGTDDDKTELVICIQNPPKFFRKRLDVKEGHKGKSTHWSEKSMWLRQTDIMQDNPSLKEVPFTLCKNNSIIDIGRWTTYRLVFRALENNKFVFKQICDALSDYNIPITHRSQFNLIPRTRSTGWDWITTNPERSGSTLASLMVNDVCHLSFPVRYQLEVCISQGCLHEQNITKEFIERLAAMKEQEALKTLERVIEKKQRYFEPMEIFKLDVPRSSLSKGIPQYCVYSRTANVTPSTMYFGSRTVETSNRIVRQYKEHQDRFLRVRFSDERYDGKVHSTHDDTQNAVFTRIFRCLKYGILIGDRHFEFLAFGNSQFREHSAYFFASEPLLTAEHIRAWMGDFSDIFIIAKYASRLGQCFSTTRAINGTKVQIKEIDDVDRNGYQFTDGVGKISKFLALMIAAELGLPNASDDPPSLFQFRLGGCKGVLAIAPEVGVSEVHIRKSQYKFPAAHEGLEIIRCASLSTAFLNRQLIIILKSLGLSDSVFITKLDLMMEKLRCAMTDETLALSMLQEVIDENQMTLTVAGIMLDGFMEARDPFAKSLLHLWRAWMMKGLKEKARIPIQDGAFLLGCTDETATLKGHFFRRQPGPNATQKERMSALPEIFVKVADPKNRGKYRIIEGVCFVARNPSLHPGDVRVVRAVDVPALHHLKNVVVFPQTGDRDLPNMCSGGDLDGDDFYVVWDASMIPPEWDHPAMDFKGLDPDTINRLVNVEDIQKFFVCYIESDSLGSIANAHLATADRMADGAKNPKCLRLAQLHSTAVDYAKSGKAAVMEGDLRPRQYPHFMKNLRRSADKIYHSETVCGQLYDMVEKVDFNPLLHLQFDPRILNAYDLSENLMETVSALKVEYDAAMRRIMAQHEIQTEFEVWTTFVLAHSEISSDYKFHEEIGRTSSTLKERFQNYCYEKSGGKNWDTLGPFVAAMYTVTAREVKAALNDLLEMEGLDQLQAITPEKTAKMPLISFPWLFQKELGKIAKGDPGQSIKAQQGDAKRHVKKMAQPVNVGRGHDDIETAEGVTHRGELLELFHDCEHQVKIDEDAEGEDVDGKGVEGQNVEGEDIEGEEVEIELDEKPSALEKLLDMLEGTSLAE